MVWYYDLGQVSNKVVFTWIRSLSCFYLLLACRPTNFLSFAPRYLAVEVGKWPPITRGRMVPDCRNTPGGTNSEVGSLSFHRLFEASSLLDKVHTAIHEPTSQQSFNVEEASMIVTTLTSFETIVEQEIAGKSKLSSSGLVLATTSVSYPYDRLTMTLTYQWATPCLRKRKQGYLSRSRNQPVSDPSNSCSRQFD